MRRIPLVTAILPTIGLLLVSLPVARSSPPTAAGPVTVLDPVFVEVATENPWQYISVPGFELISRCPERFTATYAHALRLATAARLTVLPAAFWGELPTPFKLVLYHRAPEPGESALSASPIDLSWAAEDGATAGPDSIQFSHPVTVGDGDTFINCGNYWDLRVDSRDLSVDPDTALRLGLRVPQFPAWFVAGLEGPCGLLRNRVIRSTPQGDLAILPNARWISPAETSAIQGEEKNDPKAAARHHPRTLLPLGELFRGATFVGREDLWNAETALLVRWGLYQNGNRQGFLDFVSASAQEPVTEQLFQRFLGLSYGEAQQRLGDYLFRAVTEPINVPLPTQPEEPLNVREATSIEIARIVGDWGRLESRSVSPQYAGFQHECLERTQRLFDRALLTKSDDPLFLAAFGLYALQAGDSLRARPALEAATGAGVLRPRAYVELARLRLEVAIPSAPDGIGDLRASEFEQIMALLNTARQQMPALLSTYNIFVRAFEHAPSKPTREDLRVLDEAVQLFPRNAALACKVANLYRGLGYAADATALIDRAMRFAESDPDRALLAGFVTNSAR